MAAPRSVEAVELATLLTCSVASIYPTAPGLTTGTQAGQAGDMAYQDQDASFIAAFRQPKGSLGMRNAGRAPGPSAGPTGGQNIQRR